MKLRNLVVICLLLSVTYTYANADKNNLVRKLDSDQTAYFQEKRRNVVDYYQLIFTRTRIYQKHSLEDNANSSDAEWIVSDDDAIYPSTVDIKNGFIQVEKEFGDAYRTIQVVLFRDNQGGEVIGVYSEMQVGAYFGYGDVRLTFYQLNKEFNELIDVTKEVMPDMTLASFGASIETYKKLENINDEDFQDSIENSPLIRYELPQYGTSLAAHLILRKTWLRDMIETRSANQAETGLLKNYYDQIKADTLELKWDKEQSKFILP